MKRYHAYMKKINSISLLTKIIFIIFVSSSLMLFVEIIGRERVCQAYDEQFYHRTAQVLVSYVDRIEAEFDKIDTLTLSIIGENSMQSNLQLLKAENSQQRREVEQNLKYSLQSHKGFYETVEMLCICLPDGSRIGSLGLGRELALELIETARQNKGKLVLIPKGEYIWGVRQIRQIERMTMEELGTIVIGMDLKNVIRIINEKYKNMDLIPNISIYSGEECIYSTTPDMDKIIWSDVHESWKIIDDQFVVRAISKELGWEFYGTVPYGQIKRTINVVNRQSMIILVVATILSLAFCTVIVKSILIHIRILLKKFNDFGKGILPDKTQSLKYEGRTDEIGLLHNQFDQVAIGFKEMSDIHYKNMVLLKEAQFDQLQKQMHPHFLFNALSIIVWSAYDHGDEDTANIADALGQILRQSFYNKEKLITVRQELEIVESYIVIQKSRFANRFTLEMDLQDEVLDVKVPTFTLQPMIENIIIHVVEKTLEHCYIRITGRLCDDVAEIIVEDSGRLLDPDIMRKLETGECQAKGNGVGLHSIHNRIKLAFSEEYGLFVANSDACSRIIIKVPAKTEQLEFKAERTNK